MISDFIHISFVLSRRLIAWGIICVAMVGCASLPEVDNRSSYFSMYSEAMKKDMGYSVYTPPNWTSAERLPLVVLLHGRKDDELTFDRYRVGQYLDKRYEQGKLPRAVILSPDGENGFWENWRDGSKLYRDWVVKDLMPVIQKEYATLPCPDYCHVSGLSMGAHGAMKFGINEPELFSSVAAISGVMVSRTDPPNFFQKILIKLFIPTNRIWGDIDAEIERERLINLDPYLTWTENPKLENTRLFLSWGNKERASIRKSNERFHQYLLDKNRTHDVFVYDGRHLWVDWKEPIAKSIQFHISEKK